MTLRLESSSKLTVWGAAVQCDTSRLELLRQEGSTLGTLVPDSRGASSIATSEELRLGGYSLDPIPSAQGILARLVYRCPVTAASEAQCLRHVA